MLAARTLALRGAASAALLLCYATAASAATATWNGNFPDWFDGTGNNNRWDGNEPGPADTAIFNAADNAEMTTSNEIGALTMSGGASLSTGGFALTVDGLAQLAGANTDLTLGGDSILIADSVTVNSGAEIFLRGGSILVVEETGDGLLDVNLGGEITGHGVIFLGDSPTIAKSLFDLDGTLTATGFAPGFGSPPPAAILQIIGSNANVRANLDGAGGGGDGIVIVNHNATLDVNVPLSDPFDGTLELRVNSTFDMSSPWTFGGAGVSQINVNSGAVGFPFIAAAPAHIAGAALTQTGGTISLNQADEALVFDAVFNQTGGAIANSGTIVFNSNSNLTGGSFTNNGNLTVNPGRTVNISNNFDIDGSGPGGATIGSGALLDLSLSGSADEIFNGVVRLNGGTLEVTTSDNHWEVDNLITGVGTGASFINGESVTPHNITVGANSSLQINVPTTFDVANVSVGAGASLFLAGAVTYDQPGTKVLTGPGSVFPQVTTVADGTVEVSTGVYKLDLGPHTIEPLSAMRLDVGNIDFPGNPASDTYDHNTITVNGSLFRVAVADGEWELGDEGVIILDRPSGGNRSQLSGSTLRVTSGAINVQGDSEIVDDVILTEGTALTIVDDANFRSRLNVLTLQGGDVVDSINRSTNDSVFDLQGTLSVTGTSTIDVETFLWDHGPTTISRFGNLSILAEEIQEGGVQNLTQLYRGTTDINGGRLFVDLDQLMDNNWTMDGTMNLSKSTAEQPTLASADFLIIGDNSAATPASINVTGAGQSNIDAQVLFNADAVVNIGAGALLNMSDDATFRSQFNAQNAQFTGAGTWRLAGGALFERPTTINMPAGTVDLAGGATIETPVTLNLGTMTSVSAAINIDIGPFAAGSLAVNLTNPASSWTVNSGGSIDYDGDAMMRTFLDGSDLNLNGSLVVDGQGAVGARLNIGQTGVVTIGVGDVLSLLEFPNTINGGTINGPGTLNAVTNSALFGFGVINAPIDFDGNSDLRAQDGLLTVNGLIIEVGEIGTNNNAGILNVPNPWNTNVANSVQMAGGELRGATITNDGLIDGFGLVSVDQLFNNGTIAASSQTLTLDRRNTPNGYDWDGAADTGTLNAQLGDMTLVATSAATFNGDMNIDEGHVLFVDGFPMELDAASQITFRGGVYRANFPQTFEGRIDTDVLTVAEIDAPGTFAAGSQLVIDATLQLRQSMTIAQGAAVTGLGTITNLSGATLTIANAVDVDLTLDNRGTLALGASPGQITGNDYLQSATGAWNVEIGGIAASQFDRMTLSGQAFLAGALNIALLPGFMPALGQTFDILTAPGGVTGAFTAVDEPDNMPPGLLFDVIYNPTFVRLQVVNSPIFTADFDRDGDVDNADFTVWKNSYGANAGADANADGRSDGFDFLAWQRQRGSVPAVPAGETVPEPTTTLLLAAACLAALGSRRAVT